MHHIQNKKRYKNDCIQSSSFFHFSQNKKPHGQNETKNTQRHASHITTNYDKTKSFSNLSNGIMDETL